MELIVSLLCFPLFLGNGKGILMERYSIDIQFFANVLTLLGRYSLPIYILHFYFINLKSLEFLAQECIPIQLCVIILMALIISYICIGMKKIVERVEVLNLLLFGR